MHERARDTAHNAEGCLYTVVYMQALHDDKCTVALQRCDLPVEAATSCITAAQTLVSPRSIDLICTTADHLFRDCTHSLC